eukprot:CAMPEP_0174708178 /NCGR_PEP_ID=MMETSP1094-20130205/10497_1 /TAXON_ID=156173 /ORGANISM="Chrysochromulina brevifilum, Strain UTEX LB 985" /LENGTH=324 /DNA_ID=CAMNT_0015906691 /DNA_START=32 /DNA_END=1006 /DNA_ORIENTATION=-
MSAIAADDGNMQNTGVTASMGAGAYSAQNGFQTGTEYDQAVYQASGANPGTMFYMMAAVAIGYMFFFTMMMVSCYTRPSMYGYYRTVTDVEMPKPPLTGVVAQLDAQWRKAFITKVYAILCVQLAITVAISFVMMQFGGYDLARWVMTDGYWTRNASFIASIAVLIGLMCYKNKHPLNIILLGVFTCFMSYLIGLTCTFYAAAGMGVLVVEAFAITSIIFIALTAFAMYSKIDFSFLGMILPCLLLILIVWGFFVFVFFDSFAFRQAYALAGTIIFVLYILYDTHSICERMEYDDYVFGAVSLYLDFLNLFLFILQLLSGGRRD